MDSWSEWQVQHWLYALDTPAAAEGMPDAPAVAAGPWSGKPDAPVPAGALGDESRSMRIPASDMLPLGSVAGCCMRMSKG